MTKSVLSYTILNANDLQQILKILTRALCFDDARFGMNLFLKGKNMKKLLIVTAFICAVFLSACTDADTAEDGNFTVYTSFNAMYQFTKDIAGDRAEVKCLMPSGVEPHDWEPSSADIVNLQKADVFIYNSDSMETWADKVINSIENEKIITVETAEDILTDYSDGHTGENGEHNHSEGDPHVWLNPANALKQMEMIADALCRADSENADYYKANLSAASEKIARLDAEYKSALGGIENEYIIVSHEAYGYLCDAYGLKQVGIKGKSAESEPSPAQMAEIIDFAKKNGIKYVFAENNTDTKLADTVAKELGGEVLVLNPFESGTQDYYSVMEENLSALKKALGE